MNFAKKPVFATSNPLKWCCEKSSFKRPFFYTSPSMQNEQTREPARFSISYQSATLSLAWDTLYKSAPANVLATSKMSRYKIFIFFKT